MDSPVLGGMWASPSLVVWSGGREAGQCAPDDRSLHCSADTGKGLSN